MQDVLTTLKECIKKNSNVALSAEDETMLKYVSAQAARLIDVKVFTPSEWSSKVRVLGSGTEVTSKSPDFDSRSLIVGRMC